MSFFSKYKWSFSILTLIICFIAAWKPSISFYVSCNENVSVKVYYNNLNEDVFDILHSNPTSMLSATNKHKIFLSVGNYRQTNSIRIDFSETNDNIVISDFKVDYFPLVKCTFNNFKIIENISKANIDTINLTDEGIVLNGCSANANISLHNINNLFSFQCLSINWEFIVRFIRNILIIIICRLMINKLKIFNFDQQKIIIQMGYWIIAGFLGACLISFFLLPILSNLITYLPLHNLNIYFLSAYNFSFNRWYFFFIISLTASCFKIWGKDYIYKRRHCFILLLFILLVIGKFSYSSINSYDLMLFGNTENYENPTILGKAQGIRADEWAIEKPYYFAQAAEGVDFPYYNDNLMISGADMVIMAAAPIKNIMILSHPALIGFLFLPAEYAFSFYWNFRIILLFLGGFELGNILFKKKSHALALAISLLFSPPIQWWLSQVTIDMIIWGQLSIVIWFQLISTEKKHIRIIYAILLALSINCYIYVMYPAAQIPFAYFYIALVTIISYLHKEWKPFRFSMWGYYFISLLIVGTFACYFIYMSGSALKVMMNTVYPGNNRSWGTYSWDYELLPFMNLFTSIHKDSPYLNNCEAAQFIYFLPHIIIISVYLLKNNKNYNKIKALLFLEGLVIFFEIMTKIPKSTIISDCLFLGMTYPRRLYLVVGYGFFWIMWMIIDIYFEKKIEITNVKKWCLCIFVGLIFCILYSPILRDYFEIGLNYIGTIMVFLLATVYTYIGACLFTHKSHKKFIVCYIVLCIFSTAFVNPIIINTDCIYEKASVKAVQKIATKSPNDRWIISGNAGIGNMLSSTGIKRCSGYYYYPDINMMKIIDPELKYENVWNSFSAIDMRLYSGENYIDSDGISLVVWINLKTAKQLGIKYIYSINYDYSNLENLGIVNKLYKDLVDNVQIYEIVYSTS